jgi:hypothetical protein
MKPESPRIDQQRMVSPHAQEIEYALILQRMINAVNDDPAQMRMTIYEFARARLRIDTSRSEDDEQQRLRAALETAIQGVENFSARRDEMERLPSPNPQMQIAAAALAPLAQAHPITRLRPVDVPTEEILAPARPYRPATVEQFVDVRSGSLLSMLARLSVGILLFGLVAALAYNKQRLPSLTDHWNLAQLTSSRTTKPSAAPDPSQQGSMPADGKAAIASPASPSFPLPSDYGVYALGGDKLSELFALSERVPDKRIAISTPIDKPSRTKLEDGKARFVIFRRDLVGNAPERVEVRVVAQVVRALTFDSRGKPNFASVSDTWNIRSVSHEFRVRPIPGNPEMLLVQSDKPDFALPSGRYVLVLKDQGYDFTVAGTVTDLAQCLERTDAANGTFYSECLKF